MKVILFNKYKETSKQNLERLEETGNLIMANLIFLINFKEKLSGAVLDNAEAFNTKLCALFHHWQTYTDFVGTPLLREAVKQSSSSRWKVT